MPKCIFFISQVNVVNRKKILCDFLNGILVSPDIKTKFEVEDLFQLYMIYFSKKP